MPKVTPRVSPSVSKTLEPRFCRLSKVKDSSPRSIPLIRLIVADATFVRTFTSPSKKATARLALITPDKLPKSSGIP